MYNNNIYTVTLCHHGIKGQRWGIQNGPPYPLNSSMSESKARKCAKKDAKEFARAKMFYGEGAGNRRKLIKNIVEERSKNPVYKKAFDEALSKQDMAKHAQKAKQERRRKNAENNIKGTGKRIINSVRNNPRRVISVINGAATVATVAAMYKRFSDAMGLSLKDLINKNRVNKGREFVETFIY